jgi:hypothetical protein
MNVNWSNELQVLDHVAPSRDLWADALARTASPRPHAHHRFPFPRWRRRTVALATGVGIASITAAILFALGAFNAGAAYAVTKNADGTVTITLSQFSALPALNQELAQSGLPLKAVPATADCPFNPTQGLPTDPGGGSGLLATDSITIGTSDLRDEGAIDVIGVQQVSPGRFYFMYAGVPAPGPSCINSSAFGTP